METINHEYYVSPEVAKLLKEAGFNWKCNRHYTEGRNILFEKAEKGHVIITRNQSEYPSLYFAPTLDVAQRWLREVKMYNLIVNISINEDNPEIIDYEYFILTNDKTPIYNTNLYFYTYEEALEAGIKKALEIILEKGE